MIIDFHLHYFKGERFILNALREMDRAGVEESVLIASPGLIWGGDFFALKKMFFKRLRNIQIAL